MKTCQHCGVQLEDNVKFCGECGTKQEAQKKFCTECGSELEAGARFCLECGSLTEIGKEEQKRKEIETARLQAEAELARLRAEEEARKKAEEEARAKAEEEARIKAEEEKKRKAEEEARLKAEEEARIKAEEEAKRKAEEDARKAEEAKREAEEKARREAEEEARRKEGARIRAEKEAKLKAKKEARIKELERSLPELKNKDAEAKSRLNEVMREMETKKHLLENLGFRLEDITEDLEIIDSNGQSLVSRFKVVLTKRVESGLFNKKGEIFNTRLLEITEAPKERLQEWYSELKLSKRVFISDSMELTDALSWKAAIEVAGGNAEISSDITDDEAERLMAQYQSQYQEKYTEKANIEKEIRKVENDIAAFSPKADDVQKVYDAAHLEYKKCELEIAQLSSNISIIGFIKQADTDSDNGPALKSLYGQKYTDYLKEKESARRKAEEEARKAAEKAKKERLKAEETARKKAEKEEQGRVKRQQELQRQEMLDNLKKEMAPKLKNLGDVKIDLQNAYIEELSSMMDKVNDAISEGSIEWKEYLTDFYWQKSVLQYGIIKIKNRKTLVVRGKGRIPDVEENSSNQGKNKWHVNPEFIDDCKIHDIKIKTIVIMGEITHLGARCFDTGCFYDVETVILPRTLEEIGVLTFANLLSLKQVFIPRNIKTIKSTAFEDCEDLSKAIIVE